MKARMYLPAILLAALAVSACANSTGQALAATAVPALDDKAVCQQVAKAMQEDIKFAEQHVIITPPGKVATYGKLAGPYLAEYRRMADELGPTVTGAANPKTKALLQQFVAQLRKPITADSKVDGPKTGPDFDYFEKTNCDFDMTVNF